MGNCGEGMSFKEDEVEEEVVMRSDASVNVHGPKTYRHKRDVAVNDHMRWRNGIIPYEIDHSLDYNRGLIEKAMGTIEKYSRIQFIERNYEKPFLRFSKLDGCYFNDGNGKYPRISLGIGCQNYGTVLHELMHAIGFPHEQRRPDRDEYITIYWKNIERGEESQFRRLDPSEYKWSDLPFDYDSIMLYNSYGFSKNGRRTIETKEGEEIPSNTDLSYLDKKKLRSL